MKKLLIAALLTLIAGNALAAGAEPLLSSDNRIRELAYSDEDVYTITTKYGYQTNIVFGKGEEIQTISVGDRSLWQLIPAGNRLFIRPMEYGMETNMTLITNKHAYQFDLKSVADDKSGGNIYVVRFAYPAETAKQAGKFAAMPPAPLLAEAALNHPAAPAYSPPRAQPEPVFTPPAPAPVASQPSNPNYNYNYTYAGPDALAPLKAYDDGKSTFIQYRQDEPLPSVYMIDAGGKPQPVSYTIRDDVIVIDRIAGEWRLDDNSGNVRLYNETLNPG